MLSRRYYPFLFALAVLTGCGKPVNLPKLNVVKGTVTSSGQAVKGGRLALKAEPDNPDLNINALVDQNGFFEVISMDRDGKKRPGAPEGNYRVTYIPQTTEHNVSPIELPALYTVEAKANQWTVDLPKEP